MDALRGGWLDFGSLASPPRARAAAGVTIYYVTFDLITEDDRDWRPEPYRARRRRLEQLLAGVEPPLQLTPATTDQNQAMQWLNPVMAHSGIEGFLVKDREKPYRVGRTGDWRKVRSVGQGATYRAVLTGEQLDAVRDGCSSLDGPWRACRSQSCMVLVMRARTRRSPMRPALTMVAIDSRRSRKLSMRSAAGRSICTRPRVCA
jgi:hypothetical protein